LGDLYLEAAGAFAYRRLLISMSYRWQIGKSIIFSSTINLGFTQIYLTSILQIWFCILIVKQSALADYPGLGGTLVMMAVLLVIV
jgi:Gpi18-like mannosyltransferase